MRSAPLSWLVVLGSLIGCAAARSSLPDFRAEQAPTANLAWWLAEHPLADDQNIRIDELDRTPWSSLHVVQIRGSEPLHMHHEHDLEIMLERGRGTLQLGAQRLSLQPGRWVRIPRGTPHAFANESPQPAIGVAVFRPPYDGFDSIKAE